MPISDNVMVDIETTGTSPDRNGIIQITAIRFNLEQRTVDHNWFNRCLALPMRRSWDESTRDWWMNKPEVISSIYQRMEDPRVVMDDFLNWINNENVGQLVFWSKPLSFDFPFVASYFRDYEMGMPFPFWLARDLRSFIAGRNPNFDEKTVPFQGPAHDALFDTLHQIALLFAATAPEG